MLIKITIKNVYLNSFTLLFHKNALDRYILDYQFDFLYIANIYSDLPVNNICIKEHKRYNHQLMVHQHTLLCRYINFPISINFGKLGNNQKLPGKLNILNHILIKNHLNLVTYMRILN